MWVLVFIKSICTLSFSVDVSPIINNGEGDFKLDPPNGTILIGDAACQNRRGDPSAELVHIHCDIKEGTKPLTTWKFNGQEQSAVTNNDIIMNFGPGTYTCVVSTADCGSTEATTTIYGT